MRISTFVVVSAVFPACETFAYSVAETRKKGKKGTFVPDDSLLDTVTDFPWRFPSAIPSDYPSEMPNLDATLEIDESVSLSAKPSDALSDIPSDIPSDFPSWAPSYRPSCVEGMRMKKSSARSMKATNPESSKNDAPSSCPEAEANVQHKSKGKGEGHNKTSKSKKNQGKGKKEKIPPQSEEKARAMVTMAQFEPVHSGAYELINITGMLLICTTLLWFDAI